MPIFHKNDLHFLPPQWPASDRVKAITTTRLSGASSAPYDHFNVALHVGDNRFQVEQNRTLLKQTWDWQHEPFWLQQEHTAQVVYVDQNTPRLPVADAAWTNQTEQPLVIMTADCLPILITNDDANLVAAVHAGWKGLAQGIVTQTIQTLPDNPANLMAWVGPAISQVHFEVGQDVVDAFANKPFDTADFFVKKNNQKWLANLAGLVDFELQSLGVTRVFQSNLCSYEKNEWFYSYRRDGTTGRMASLIWLSEF